MVFLVAQSVRMASGLNKEVNRFICFEHSNIFFPVPTVTVSNPELRLATSEKSASVQCEVRSSSSKLEMEFLDEEGNVLQCNQPKFYSEDTGFFIVIRKMLVPGNITRFEFASELHPPSTSSKCLASKGAFYTEIRLLENNELR